MIDPLVPEVIMILIDLNHVAKMSLEPQQRKDKTKGSLHISRILKGEQLSFPTGIAGNERHKNTAKLQIMTSKLLSVKNNGILF